MENSDKVLGMWLGGSLFILVITAVFVLVWFKSESLTFDKSANLIGKGVVRYGEMLQSPMNEEYVKTMSVENE